MPKCPSLYNRATEGGKANLFTKGQNICLQRCSAFLDKRLTVTTPLCQAWLAAVHNLNIHTI